MKTKSFTQSSKKTKKKLNAAAVVTIVVFRISKARDTKWVTRSRLKQQLVFLIF